MMEILANIGLSMVMFLRGRPNDETVNRNIDLLMATDWFKQIYVKNEAAFKNDEALRYIIGWANIKKSLSSEKRTHRLRRKIIAVINNH